MNTIPAYSKPSITFMLTIDSQPMQIRYTPNWMTSFPVGRFEFFSPSQPRRRMPVSETGYLSHFVHMAEIEAAPSPEDFAHALALEFMRVDAARKLVAEADQPALF